MVSRTNLVKIFNGIGSLGLGICVAVVPLFTSEDQKLIAVFVLCLANFFAGKNLFLFKKNNIYI